MSQNASPPSPTPSGLAGPASRDEYVGLGREARRALPLDAHAELNPPPGQDPVAILEAQSATRVPQLIPVRYGRMLVDPFTFYRGSAAIMADDLGQAAHSGLTTQLCGDAHVSNFGFFASPERRLKFDLNDFDETFPGPFEWDVKRLAASLEIAGRANGYRRKDRARIVRDTVGRYREAMRGFAKMPTLDVWYAQVEVEPKLERLRSMASKGTYKATRKVTDKARTRTSEQALGKLTATVDGATRFASVPPVLVPLRDLSPAHAQDLGSWIRDLVTQYQATLRPDRRVLLDRFAVVDIAHRVVGVGSVGTQAWVLLCSDSLGQPLVLQAKEAVASVLEPFVDGPTYASHGQRVVEGQRLIQSASDIFLGWLRVPGEASLDGGGPDRDYYIRQFRDWKGSYVIESMSPDVLRDVGAACAWTMARAHARAGNRVAIAAYLGRKDTFDTALTRFATAYADKGEADFAQLREAVADGRLPSTPAV